MGRFRAGCSSCSRRGRGGGGCRRNRRSSGRGRGGGSGHGGRSSRRSGRRRLFRVRRILRFAVAALHVHAVHRGGSPNGARAARGASEAGRDERRGTVTRQERYALVAVEPEQRLRSVTRAEQSSSAALSLCDPREKKTQDVLARCDCMRNRGDVEGKSQ